MRSFIMTHCDGCCHGNATGSVNQTMDEMEFERGLWGAAVDGDIDKCHQLINNGKDVNETDSSGYTALHYASRSGHLSICHLLVSHGAAVNATTRSGRTTPLQRAAGRGFSQVCAYLLEHGAISTMQDSDEATALHKAAESGRLEVVQLLVRQFPGMVDMVDRRGKRAVDCVPGDHADVIKVLQK